MTNRQAVSRIVERALWAESSGYCLNPACKKNLIINNSVSIADMAHIEPHSAGGQASAENMILLCKNCHKEYEPVDHPEKKETLFAWKKERQQETAKRFCRRFENFDDLSAQVVPLLEENYQIFSGYGPKTNDPEAFKMWKKFEPQLIVNNAKLKQLFHNNLHLFANNGKYNNAEAIRYFILHVDEFAETRDGHDGVRKFLFPWRVLSIFGIEAEVSFYTEQSINAIQNLIGTLKAKGCKVELSLSSRKNSTFITITENNKVEILSLNDIPRVNQLVFSENANNPHSTDMRLDNLQFVLKTIENVGANWKFEDISDLTTIKINRNLKAKLFYVYEVSEAHLQSTDLTKVRYAVNLHNWNRGPSTKGAQSYAQSIGIVLMNFDEFIELCRRDSR